MNYQYNIPPSFWSLFRSVNRDTYIEALLAISDEYQYNNYFLSKEACIQILADMCAGQNLRMEREETETDEEAGETLPRRILNWLIHAGWLRRVEDYASMAVNIVIPDYASVLIEAFEKLAYEQQEDTEVYIQNVYATLFSFKNDPRMNLSMLKTALINTRKLNKALQDMLHNMDRFFDRLLEKQTYGDLLREHLDGYVEEVVRRKYHILKTSDNFYIYKMDIRRCLKEMREDEEWVERVRAAVQKDDAPEHPGAFGGLAAPSRESGSSARPLLPRRRQQEDVLELIDQIERGFEMIERRIANMDREHSKYIRATVSRLNYLLSGEDDRHGLLVQLLNRLGEENSQSAGGRTEARIAAVAARMNLSAWEVLGENPLYKRRQRRNFMDTLEPEAEDTPLSAEEILRLNRIHHRFTRAQVEAYIEERMEQGCLDTRALRIGSQDEFEKLILAYDFSMRKNSPFTVKLGGEQVQDGVYVYPAMLFVKKTGKEQLDA